MCWIETLPRLMPRPLSRRPNVTVRKPGLRPLLQLARPRSIVMSTFPKSKLQEPPKQETKNFEEMLKLSALRLSLRDSYVSIPQHHVSFNSDNIYREPVMSSRPPLPENPSNRLQMPRTTRRKLPQTQLCTVSRRPLMPMHIKFAFMLRLHISPPPRRPRQLLSVNKRKLQVSIWILYYYLSRNLLTVEPRFVCNGWCIC
jgi:hypothetical protein